MQRLDPQDAGPAYRNVIGLPGGVNSPFFKILKVSLLWSLKALHIHDIVRRSQEAYTWLREWTSAPLKAAL